MSTLHCEGLRVRVAGRTLLDALDFGVAAGELVGIVGANGAGKSTLFKALLGILPADCGTITVDGQPLASLHATTRARRIAYLAQGHAAHWPLSVREVVTLGRLPHVRSARDEAIVEQMLRATDLAHLAHRNVLTLSGGERARTMLARALAVTPAVLLADEPLAALDPAHQLRIMQLLREQTRQGLGVGIVLHDLPLAARFCTRLVLLHEGRVLASGTPCDVLNDAALATAFGIGVARFSFEGAQVPLPWTLTPAPLAGA
ncbi:MAG: ABC transporter ATP-binding protein [Rhodocyclaceae bacterium]